MVWQRNWCSASLLVIAFVFLFVSHPVHANPPFLAILPFEGAEIRQWFLDRDQMIEGITQMCTDEIAKSDSFRVVERSRLEQIITEQDFGRSGRVDTYTAAELGRLIGAEYLLLGTLTSLELYDAGQIRIGALRIQGMTSKVGLSARIVNVETAEIASSVQVLGDHTSGSISLQQFQNISFQSNTFQNSVLGRAIKDAVVQLADELNEISDQLVGASLADRGRLGAILATVGPRYIVDLGAEDGVVLHDRLQVFQLVEVEGLSNPVEVPMGTLRVISVDSEASVAEAEGSERFEIGYAVRR